MLNKSIAILGFIIGSLASLLVILLIFWRRESEK